jgi:hypothetical protein
MYADKAALSLSLFFVFFGENGTTVSEEQNSVLFSRQEIEVVLAGGGRAGNLGEPRIWYLFYNV